MICCQITENDKINLKFTENAEGFIIVKNVSISEEHYAKLSPDNTAMIRKIGNGSFIHNLTHRKALDILLEKNL